MPKTATATATEAETDNDLRLYECMVILPMGLNPKERDTTLKNIEDAFGEKGGKQVSKDVWGRRGLAYRLKGQEEGYFVVYHYDIAPEHIREIESELKIEKHLLRHLIAKPPKGYQITKFSESYETWLKEKDEIVEVQAKKKEEELKKKIVKRAAKKDTSAPKAQAEAPKQEEIEEKLGELIEDEDLNL